MRGENARIIVQGGWGTLSPDAFSYDLFRGALWDRAKSLGLLRYGKKSGDGDDSRPVAASYSLVLAGGSWAPQSGAPALKALLSGDPTTAYRQSDTAPNAAKSYISNFNVGRNEGHSYRFYIYEKKKTQNLKLDQLHWGVPGAGALFQIRDGKPEVGFKSVNFNLNDLATLHTLWAVANPSNAQAQQIDDLIERNFDSFESLSFENATGKDDWYNNAWAVTFIAEPRGVMHVVLEGGDATAIENKVILETRLPGTLWKSGPVRMFSAGGGFWVQAGYPKHSLSSRLDFGPFRELSVNADDNVYFFNNLSYTTNAYFEQGVTSVGLGRLTYPDGPANSFGFRATLTTNNPRKTAWIYGMNANLAPGARNGDLSVVFDTDNLYKPVNPDAPRMTKPAVLDIEADWDAQTGARSAKVRVWDPRGLTTTNRPLPTERVTSITIAGAPFITRGLTVSPLTQTDMMNLDSSVSPSQTIGWGTEMVFTVRDGWEILRETEVDPSPVLDGLNLGGGIRSYLTLAGYDVGEISGVGKNAGPKISKAQLGEIWACRCDSSTSCADAIRGLLESYGLGWKLFQDRSGIWQLVQLSSVPMGVFSSTGVGHSNLTAQGRLQVLRPLDVIHDNGDFCNDFIVIGGKDGEIVRRLTLWESINIPDSPNWIGRKKTKRLTNSGLRTVDEVEYALRSMEWMYGRTGRRAQFVSYFNTILNPGDRVGIDNGIWEIEGMGGSWAQDEMQFSVLEVGRYRGGAPIVIDGSDYSDYEDSP